MDTGATLKDFRQMALVKINGVEHFFNAEEVTITPVSSSGRWEVAYDGGNKFVVVGGTKSGGSRFEWFCYHPKFFGEEWQPCGSMVAAIRMGVQY